jgi:hypothetical protein
MGYTEQQLKERAYLRVATALHSLWEEGRYDTNLLNGLMIPDNYVLVGESANGNARREHIIPRKVICQRVSEMFDADASVDEVAKFIETHLKIVLVSKDDQERMDMLHRQRMPDGWTFEDGDVFARLKLAGIELKSDT